MAFWGGPIGTFTTNGEVVSGGHCTRATPAVTRTRRSSSRSSTTGTASGSGRGHAALGHRDHLAPDHFTFFGAITPGDSGSGSNALTGDGLGANREAAGINTHIYVDGITEHGVGTIAGTRSTFVAAGSRTASSSLTRHPRRFRCRTATH